MFVVSLTCVFAQENATVLNETDIEDSFNLQNDCGLVDNQGLSSSNPDSPDMIINITQRNIKQYFRSGTLRDSYSNAELFISEDMDNLGILHVKAGNVTINGMNHTLTNTVFSIEADGVTLNNLTLIETEAFENNDYAAVCIWRANDVNLYNINIDYTAPSDSDAYGIYSFGIYDPVHNRDYRIFNLEIVNCTVNLKGDNRAKGRVYGVKLEESPNARVLNNVINCELPLRSVDFAGSDAYLDSEYSLAVGVENCPELVFDSNKINCRVNARPECNYPTLDAIFIRGSENCNFTNNDLYLCDFITPKDVENYLYGLDIWSDDNLLIENNSIRVETTGGTYAAGTAYPIQISGSRGGVTIRYNDIYSKSNGPNIGIYSQNTNNATFVTILNNYINVTGLAGNHSWALVAGIEAQDNSDIIMNNIIEIHNIQKVEKEDNIYGISYSQKTQSKHTYMVVNNTVISDGYYVAHMRDADDTNVTNNTLVRTDKYADTGYDPFKRGEGIGEGTDGAKNNNFSGNRVITIFEYDLEHQSSYLGGDDDLHYDPPENVDNISNIINGSGIAPLKPGFPGSNPLLPGNNGEGTFNTGGDGGGGLNPSGNNGGFINPDTPDGDRDNGFNPGGNEDNGLGEPDSPDGDNGYRMWSDLSGDSGKSQSRKNQGTSVETVNSFNNIGSSSNSYNNLVAYENSTSSESPSVDGVSSSGESSKSASSSGAGGSAGGGGAAQDSAKAYEVTKNIVENGPDDIIKFIALAIVCEILLIIGYKRKETEDVTD